MSPAAHLAGLALEQSSAPVSSKVVDPATDTEVTPIRMVQSARSHRFSDSFINDVYKTVNTQGVIEDNPANWSGRDIGDIASIGRSQTIAAITGKGSPELPSVLEVVVSSGQHLTASRDVMNRLGANPAIAKFSTIVSAWRLFVFRLATSVMALFDMKNMTRFQHFFFQRQPDPTDQAAELWVPNLKLWPSALDVISLTAARHYFLDRVISLKDLRERCSPDSQYEHLPETLNRPSEHDLDFWSDSTVNFNCRVDIYVNPGYKWAGQHSWRKKKHSFAKDLPLAIGMGHHDTHGTIDCGGTLNQLLAFVEMKANGDMFLGRHARTKTLVMVWSFNDFFEGGANYRVVKSLPAGFFEKLDRLIYLTSRHYRRVVMISGGSASTWSVLVDHAPRFCYFAACVKERMRQSGAIVICPTELYESLPRKKNDLWHFVCAGAEYRNKPEGDIFFPTIKAFISLVINSFHMVNHLIKDVDPEPINCPLGQNWADMMRVDQILLHLLYVLVNSREDDVSVPKFWPTDSRFVAEELGYARFRICLPGRCITLSERCWREETHLSVLFRLAMGAAHRVPILAEGVSVNTVLYRMPSREEVSSDPAMAQIFLGSPRLGQASGQNLSTAGQSGSPRLGQASGQNLSTAGQPGLGNEGDQGISVSSDSQSETSDTSSSTPPIDIPANVEGLRDCIRGEAWNYDVLRMVLGSKRHAPLELSVWPIHGLILGHAIPWNGEGTFPIERVVPFELEPVDGSPYRDNYYSSCSACHAKYWFYTMPLLGICTSETCVKEHAEVINRVDIRASLDVAECLDSVNCAQNLVIRPPPSGKPSAVDLNDDDDVALGLVQRNKEFNLDLFKDWMCTVLFKVRRRLMVDLVEPDLRRVVGLPEGLPTRDMIDAGKDPPEDHRLDENLAYSTAHLCDDSTAGYVPTILPLTTIAGYSALDSLADVKRVVVLGPFASSTNAMCKYLNKFFNVEVLPPLEPKTMTGYVGDANGIVGPVDDDADPMSGPFEPFTWKHTPPLYKTSGEYVFGPDTLVIQMIREPSSWFDALSRSKYTLKPVKGIPRDGYGWLQDRVKLDAPQLKDAANISRQLAKNPHAEVEYHDVIDLWACYAYGYGVGYISTGPYAHVTIVRHEDLVVDPLAVLRALAGKNLPRKLVSPESDLFVEFAPINDYIGGHRGSKRKRPEVIGHVREGHSILGDDDARRPAFVAWMKRKSSMYSRLIETMGYIPYSAAKSAGEKTSTVFLDPVDGHPMANADTVTLEQLDLLRTGVRKVLALPENGSVARSHQGGHSHQTSLVTIFDVPAMMQPPDYRNIAGLLWHLRKVGAIVDIRQIEPKFTRELSPAKCPYHLIAFDPTCRVCWDRASWLEEQEYGWRLAAQALESRFKVKKGLLTRSILVPQVASSFEDLVGEAWSIAFQRSVAISQTRGMSQKEERGIFVRTGEVPEECERLGYYCPTYGDEPEAKDGEMSDNEESVDPSKTCLAPPPPPDQRSQRPVPPTPPPVPTPEQVEMRRIPPPPTHHPVPQWSDVGTASVGKREPPYLCEIDRFRQQGHGTRAKLAKPTPSRAPLHDEVSSASVRGTACPPLPPAPPPPPRSVEVGQQGSGRDLSSAPPPDAVASRGSFAPPLAPSAGWDFSASGRHPSTAPGFPQSRGSAGFGPMSGQYLPAHQRTGPYSNPTHSGGASASNLNLPTPPPPPPAAEHIVGGSVSPPPYKFDIGWARDRYERLHRQGQHPAVEGLYPMRLETDQELCDSTRHLKIVNICDLARSPDASEASVQLAMRIYGLLTFNVVNCHILMDSGGWCKLAPICESLRLRYEDFFNIASSLPFDGLEVSVFSTGVRGDGTQDRLHGVRAKYGHFFRWIDVTRLGMVATPMQIWSAPNLHVYCPSGFSSACLEDGIGPKWANVGLPDDLHQTYVVISTSEIFSPADLLRLHATEEDEVLLLEKESLVRHMKVEKSFVVYIVDQCTFVCEGRIPPECLHYGSDGVNRYFFKERRPDGSVGPMPPPHPEKPSSGQNLSTPPGFASGSDSTDPGHRSGKHLSARSAGPWDSIGRSGNLGHQLAVAGLPDRSRSPAGAQEQAPTTLALRGNTPPGLAANQGPARPAPKRANRRSEVSRLLRAINQTENRNAIHKVRWVQDTVYRLHASNRGMTYELHQPYSVRPWRAENADDPPPVGPP
jgi:hypothetical protein